MSYTTVEDVYLGLNRSVPLSDDEVAIISALIGSAEMAIDRYCGWHYNTRLFEAGEESLKNFSVPERVRILRIPPALSVSKVTTIDSLTGEEVVVTAYYLARGSRKHPRRVNENEYARYVVLEDSYFYDRATITGIWGVSATTPADIQDIATRQVVLWFNAMQQALSGSSADDDIGRITVRYPTDLDKGIKMRLMPYRVSI